jgi:hypothetical protein
MQSTSQALQRIILTPIKKLSQNRNETFLNTGYTNKERNCSMQS